MRRRVVGASVGELEGNPRRDRTAVSRWATLTNPVVFVARADIRSAP
jgi:hypothetical protein